MAVLPAWGEMSMCTSFVFLAGPVPGVTADTWVGPG
jgi:hypothetical protein